jgi:hypothetical protein
LFLVEQNAHMALLVRAPRIRAPDRPRDQNPIRPKTFSKTRTCKKAYLGGLTHEPAFRRERTEVCIPGSLRLASASLPVPPHRS